MQPLASAPVTASGATSCSGAGRGRVGVAPPHGGSGKSGKAAAAAPVTCSRKRSPPFFLKTEKERLQNARVVADAFVIAASDSAEGAATAAQPLSADPVNVHGPAVVIAPPVGATETATLNTAQSPAAKRTRTESGRMSGELGCVAGALSPGLANTLLNLRGKDQDNGQLVTGLAQSFGVFLRAGQANQTVRNMQEEEEIYSGPTGLTAPGRNIHSLRKDLQTGCEPDAEQRGISTVLSQPARAGGRAGDAIPLPLMLTGQHEDMEQTMTPDVIADDGDGIARQQQPAEWGELSIYVLHARVQRSSEGKAGRPEGA